MGTSFSRCREDPVSIGLKGFDLTTPNALSLNGVTRRFGGITAVSDLDFEVPSGTRHGIIGPNGAGKTTLFNVLSGELSATGGTIQLFGADITKTSPARRVDLGMARTYQITRTFGALTVRENLALAVHGLKASKFSMFRGWRGFAKQSEEIDAVAERFDLEAGLDRPASELSHGELRQLEVALAVALQPKLLLLDEPGAGLSPGERKRMGSVLADLPQDLTLVMIEHDMDLLRLVVSDISVLHFGKIVAQGTSEEIQQDTHVRDIYLGRH